MEAETIIKILFVMAILGILAMLWLGNTLDRKQVFRLYASVLTVLMFALATVLFL